MSWPKITVVTPSYNQANYIELTIRSILYQGYPNLEYIVLDGGSTDGSQDIIRRYESRISYWISERDGGQAAAIRKGFELSTGEILCWLNSDDVFLPGALRAVAEEFLKYPQAEVISGGGLLINADGTPFAKPYGSYRMGIAASRQRFHYFGQEGVIQQATFWRRKAYEAVGGINPRWRFIMDFDLFARLAARRRFHQLPRLLAAFRIHEASKTLTIDDVRLMELSELHKESLPVVHPLRRRVGYEWYRFWNRTDKLRLAALRRLGMVNLPVIDEKLFSEQKKY